MIEFFMKREYKYRLPLVLDTGTDVHAEQQES